MERPKIGVGVICVKDGKVLLLRRKGAHGSDTWSFTGGHLEFGESVEECAKRETLEEAGVHIHNIRYAPYTNDIHESESKHYVTLFVLADYLSGEAAIQEPDKSDEMGWFPWEAMPTPLFLPIENLLKTGYSPFSDSDSSKDL